MRKLEGFKTRKIVFYTVYYFETKHNERRENGRHRSGSSTHLRPPGSLMTSEILERFAACQGSIQLRRGNFRAVGRNNFFFPSFPYQFASISLRLLSSSAFRLAPTNIYAAMQAMLDAQGEEGETGSCYRPPCCCWYQVAPPHTGVSPFELLPRKDTESSSSSSHRVIQTPTRRPTDAFCVGFRFFFSFYGPNLLLDSPNWLHLVASIRALKCPSRAQLH